jgi:hypothetical protein
MQRQDSLCGRETDWEEHLIDRELDRDRKIGRCRDRTHFVSERQVGQINTRR